MDGKHKLFGNFEKVLKIFDKNSIEKLKFYRLLEKLMLKIEPSEITPFSTTIFPISGGGGTFPVFALPRRRLCIFSQRTCDDSTCRIALQLNLYACVWLMKYLTPLNFTLPKQKAIFQISSSQKIRMIFHNVHNVLIKEEFVNEELLGKTVIISKIWIAKGNCPTHE